jgi:hypothetical protein
MANTAPKRRERDAFNKLLAAVSIPSGVNAASLWWSSLAGEEQELVHGAFEGREIQRGDFSDADLLAMLRHAMLKEGFKPFSMADNILEDLRSRVRQRGEENDG